MDDGLDAVVWTAAADPREPLSVWEREGIGKTQTSVPLRAQDLNTVKWKREGSPLPQLAQADVWDYQTHLGR